MGRLAPLQRRLVLNNFYSEQPAAAAGRLKRGKEWQSTHPPYQLIPHTNSTPVHTWVDQLIPSPPTAITNSSLRPSIPYQLIPSHRPSVTNSSPTDDYIVGYLNCFKVRHTDSQRLLILWECNKTHLLLEAIYFI